MPYEVENKYRITEMPTFEARLRGMSARTDPAQLQVDVYFSHPAKDFVSTDEALRIRRVGDRNVVTYKGPKISLSTKTRREIELKLGDGETALGEWTALFDALGFRVIAEVRKRRRPFSVLWEGVSVSGALDEVERLGSFVEIEIVTGSDGVAEAQRRLIRLAEALDLGIPERRSYLELLLSRETSSE